ncbi:GNAT family N-acetyltransferase [Pseudobacteroides cellulosolvens]|uniref:GCN5-related N-acetyltransferase n=1 Tax=Pseudobacteroides cellulosolvens ATCC 35603 = DSM 2933 TaxID=398512 RepID=A0A0L6JS43_9FIRM|nr:GNAT family N-acetyltransferase [Pseudobacteroides cellulosolvens]KNY28671.1 GCN5-related N-acetyltransferase [Pseudobacteroides cellulosolvens ATCC 35603 = DSM 2933]
MININIRRGNKNDIDSIANIEAKCFPVSEAASKSRIADRMNVFPNHFYVADDNGEMVGFVNGLVSDERTISDEMFDNAMLHNEKGKYQMIFGLAVLAEYRGKGIAGKLMSAIIYAAKEEGRKGVVLTCKDDLIPFYEKLGFRSKGVSKSAHGGAVWYDMELILW